MMWNSRDNAVAGRSVALPICLILLTACVAAPMTDAPAPALAKTFSAATPPKEGPYDGQRVTIRDAQAKTMSTDDPWIKRIVHPDDYSTLRTPILVFAEVTRPFADLSKTASPVIVLNGQPLTNSIVVHDKADRVYAVVPDSTQLELVLNIQVGWFGALPETLSPAVKVKLAP